MQYHPLVDIDLPFTLILSPRHDGRGEGEGCNASGAK
jgi:hypothetical protein